MNNHIKITELDYVRLNKLIHLEKNDKATEAKNITFLCEEINRAERVESKTMSPKYVTMNSIVEVVDPDTKKSMTIKLVYPNEADFKNGKVSILSPFGSALLGYSEESVITFGVPKGVKKMKIKKILYQPEANGLYTI